MPTAQKEQTIEQAKEWYSQSVGVVFTDYRGLKVKEMQQLRQNLKAKGGELHVVKNTLFRRAAGEVADTLPYEFHNGPTAIAFVYQNESDCAKVLFDYALTHKSLAVKGGIFGGKVMDAKSVEALSKLPSRDVLIAQVIGTIVAPLTNLVGVIDALVAEPVRTIYAVVDKMGGSDTEPAADLTDRTDRTDPTDQSDPTDPSNPSDQSDISEPSPFDASETTDESDTSEPAAEAAAEEPTN